MRISIREARKKMGMSQLELARRLDITQQRLSNYERHLYAPPATIVTALLVIFNLSLDDLLIPKWTSNDKLLLRYSIDSGVYCKRQGNYYNQEHLLMFDTHDGPQDCLAMCRDEATARDIAMALNRVDEEDDQ